MLPAELGSLPGEIWLERPPYPHTEAELRLRFSLSESCCCPFCHEQDDYMHVVWPDGTSVEVCCGVANEIQCLVQGGGKR